MKRFQANVRAAMTTLAAALPISAVAHTGLDESSTLLMWLHSLAHTLGEHPLITIALAGVLMGAYGVFHRAAGNRRQSD